MPKQSREQIIGELNARKIGYSEDMSYPELSELLKQADAQRPEPIYEPQQPLRTEDLSAGASSPREGQGPRPRADVRVEEPIDYSNVRCGLSTIQDLHRRITILERLIANLLSRPPVPIMMIQGKDAK